MANQREIALWAAVVVLFIVTVLHATLQLWGVRLGEGCRRHVLRRHRRLR